MHRPEIIAELSCNHLGSQARAFELIDAAADAGADAVKLQCWTPGTMAKPGYKIKGSAWNGQRLDKLYAEAHTPWDWFESLFKHARRRNLDIVVSVFDLVALDFLEGLRCPRYKIASFEANDLPLIHAVALCDKPMLLSTGMATLPEIQAAANLCSHFGLGGLTLLKCTSAYPASLSDANLATLADMRLYAPVGVSDHTLGVTVPMVATALGATVIEKHLILSRSDGGPDAGFSLEPAEFKEMVVAVHAAAKAIGTIHYGPLASEQDQLQFRRSLYWARSIQAGDEITPEHLTTSRPALGVSPGHWFRLIGTRALRAATAGKPVTPSDVCV